MAPSGSASQAPLGLARSGHGELLLALTGDWACVLCHVQIMEGVTSLTLKPSLPFSKH